MFKKHNVDSDAALRKRGSGRFFQAVHTGLFKRFSIHASPDAVENIVEDKSASRRYPENKELNGIADADIVHRTSCSPLDFASIASSEHVGSLYAESWPVLAVSITPLHIGKEAKLLLSPQALFHRPRPHMFRRA